MMFASVSIGTKFTVASVYSAPVKLCDSTHDQIYRDYEQGLCVLMYNIYVTL